MAAFDHMISSMLNVLLTAFRCHIIDGIKDVNHTKKTEKRKYWRW